DECKGGILPQHARRVAKVVSHGLDQRHTARLAAIRADLLEAAELDVGPARRLFVREPGAFVFLDLRVEMRAQFLLQLGIRGLAAQERSRTKQQIADHGCYACWRTVATAAVIFRHAVCPAWSWRRPPDVSS